MQKIITSQRLCDALHRHLILLRIVWIPTSLVKVLTKIVSIRNNLLTRTISPVTSWKWCKSKRKNFWLTFLFTYLKEKQ